MSGTLRLLSSYLPPSRHDHVDFILSSNKILRYHDPRRFGAILWTSEDPLIHPLIKPLGIEPLDTNFTGLYLKTAALNRKMAIKPFIMNNKIVVGVGNIYAAESLFSAKIHPLTPANRLSIEQHGELTFSIKRILQAAILRGGTTLKDFFNSEGKPGYFSQNLQVYGRSCLPCYLCRETLQSIKIGQRSTVFCPQCQPATS